MVDSYSGGDLRHLTGSGQWCLNTTWGSARLGIGLILLGIAAYAGTGRWMRTRIVYPVDMPVSLAAGHIRTGPFRLNLSAVYWVIVDSGDWWNGGRLCPDPRLRAKTRWALYKQGAIVDHSDGPPPTGWPTRFDVGPGIYDLDVEVLSDTGCLDPGHPRLRVFARTENYEMVASMLKAVMVLSVLLGLVLLTFLPATRAVFSREESDHLTDPPAGQNLQWAQKLPLRRPVSGLPAFGPFAAMMFGLLAVLMMLLTAGFQQTSIGWRVHLLKPGEAPQKSDAWTDPLIVLLKDAGPGQEPKVFVNSTQVDWNNLDTTLKHELARRREWTVYVGGDDCVSWVNVTNVIDIARAYHAKVFLITGVGKRCDPSLGYPFKIIR
ncbi:MAG: biopolymer transporter ExbD [Candidatus Sulfotelmatobacter sp.]